MSEQFLREHYIEKKLSSTKIAKITGYKTSTVLSALKQCGISRRKHLDLQSRNLHGGGGIPYGKKIRKGILVEHVAEQKAIRKIVELRIQHKYSLKQIVRYLNGKKIPTKTGKPRWNHESVRLILKRKETN